MRMAGRRHVRYKSSLAHYTTHITKFTLPPTRHSRHLHGVVIRVAQKPILRGELYVITRLNGYVSTSLLDFLHIENIDNQLYYRLFVLGP